MAAGKDTALPCPSPVLCRGRVSSHQSQRARGAPGDLLAFRPSFPVRFLRDYRRRWWVVSPASVSDPGQCFFPEVSGTVVALLKDLITCEYNIAYMHALVKTPIGQNADKPDKVWPSIT